MGRQVLRQIGWLVQRANLVNQADFDVLVEKFFATDRPSLAKGMVEVIQ